MKKFYLFVLGCQMNVSDAERLRFLLKELGLEEVDSEKEADIIVTIACSVKQKPIDRIWGKLKIWRARLPRPKIILTGCVTENDQKKFKEKFNLVFNIQEPQKLVNFLKNKKLVKNDFAKIESLFALTPERESHDRAYVALGNGCDNFCTYCVVPYTRGRETYRSQKEILAEVKLALKNGAKVISLIAQNVNSYAVEGKNKNEKGKIRKGKDFIELLKQINDIPGDFKIEFLTSHPKDMSDELIETVANLDKVIKWIHLPVQAGSNKILAKMNRKYTREHYLNLVRKIRKAMPHVVLTTDIIVGFPGETKKDFEETVDLVKKAKFDQAFIAPYSPRPGTVAAKMKDDISKLEKKRRFQILDKLINHKKGIKDNPWTIAQN